MRTFVKGILVFILLFIMTFCSIVILNYYFVKSERLVSDANKHILILGDSNTECALNDSILTSAINLSASADSYFYSYLKLKEIESSDSKIDTVLLAFAPHNIFDNGWLLDGSHIYSHFPIYYPFMDWNDFIFLLCNNPRAVYSSLSAIASRPFKEIIKRMIGGNTSSNYGKFQKLNRNMLKEVQLKLKNGEQLPFFNIPNSFVVSKVEELYFNKIISLCKKNNIKLYLINTPKREEILKYEKYGNKEFCLFYDKKYNNIDFLDFSGLELPEDNYGDLVHLNSRGSTNFSTLLEREGFTNLTKKYTRNRILRY